MKKYLGPIILLLSFQCLAKSSETNLFLRGTVPATHKIEIRIDKKGFHTHMKTNAPHGHARPKFFIKKSPHSYMVSVVHP